MGVIVTGEILNLVMSDIEHQLFKTFSKVALNSDVVLCCRVSPKQKQEIVAMVKKAVGLLHSET